MEFLRKVVNGSDLINGIELPKELINKKVEIIIFPFTQENKINKKSKKSLSGVLSKYAKKELVLREESAWMEASEE